MTEIPCPASAVYMDDPANPARTPMMFFLWVRDILIGVLSSFFLIWGITLLISAYHMKNPQEFIMVFFSSNFIILISGCGLLYAAFHLRKLYVERRNPS
jgi:hypothetical protein